MICRSSAVHCLRMMTPVSDQYDRLRAAFATPLVSDNIGVSNLQDLMRHESIATTKKHYIRSDALKPSQALREKRTHNTTHNKSCRVVFLLAEAGLEPVNKNTGNAAQVASGGHAGGNFSTAFLSTFAALLLEKFGFNEHEVLCIPEAASRVGLMS